ncbi:MAG: hypothetical protein IJZ86_08270 [Bacteroides sp.]|nr:hypothetical protein [Bacteroides sp.]
MTLLILTSVPVSEGYKTPSNHFDEKSYSSVFSSNHFGEKFYHSVFSSNNYNKKTDTVSVSSGIPETITEADETTLEAKVTRFSSFWKGSAIESETRNHKS